jgi:hypothetical protein
MNLHLCVTTSFPGHFGVGNETRISSFAFATDVVVDSEEYLRYDLNAIVASVGGFLGMFLGVSLNGLCLKVLNTLVKIL